MGAPASRFVAGPIHSLAELSSRRSQHDLPVGDRDQAELRIEVTTAGRIQPVVATPRL